MLTAGFDQLTGGNRGGASDDVFLGTTENNQFSSGNRTTFNPGDSIDGGTGNNTLRLFMGQGSSADGVAVSNIQTLDLRLNASSENYLSGGWQTSELVMTDWDDSLKQINISSNKSAIDIIDQQVIADVSISDQSISNGNYPATRYGFGYAAGVVDGAADGLSVTLDNVNGSEGAYVTIDDGIEQLDLTVADRAGSVNTPNRYASDVELNAEGVTKLTVDSGRAGQTFTLSANIADGAEFDSTAFAGNMVLDSNNIETAAFGAGSDTATFAGVAASADASYDMGEGDNRLTLNVAFAGEAMAGAGADTILANSTLAGSSISAGNGVNRVTIAGDHAGAITTGTGADTVGVASVAATGTIDVGAGNNVVTAGAHAGDIDAGAGNDSITVTTTAAGSAIHAGDGNNTIVATAHAGDIDTGAGNDSITVTTTAAGSGIHAGDGTNTIVATAHAGDITTTDGNDSVSVTSTAAGSSISVGNGTNTVTVTADHEGAIVGANGTNTVTIGDDMLTGSSVALGNGNSNHITVSGDVIDDADDTLKNTSIVIGNGNSNSVEIDGSVSNSTITFGNGSDNSLDIAGDLSAQVPGTVTFGNGNNNTLSVGGDIISESVVMGSGSGSEINVGGDVINGNITVAGESTTLNVEGDIDDGSSITLGNGENDVTAYAITYSEVVTGTGGDTLTLQDGVYASNIQMGNGADQLTLGADGGTNNAVGYWSNQDLDKSVVDMGAGNDSVLLKTSGGNLGSAWGYVYSTGSVQGGEGADTLTFEAEDSAKLIGRDINQIVTIDLQKAEGEAYVVGDVVSVTFTRGGEVFTVSYTVLNSDFIQGNESIAEVLATKLAAKLNLNADYGDHFDDAEVNGSVITVESTVPHEDFIITSAQADVQVEQLSDARISSFETLNLVALQTEGSDTEINANFDMISGTNHINLDSQLDNVTYVEGEDTNGEYNSNDAGGTSTFTLENLKGGESIVVKGFESSATGNQQVSHIVVESVDFAHEEGDKITVTIGDVEVVYTVTLADLTSPTAQLDANNIARSLSIAITEAATAAGMTVARDANQITLIGQAGEAVQVEVAHTRADVSDVDVSDDVDNSGDHTTWSVIDSFDTMQAGDVVTVTIGDDEFSFTVGAIDCERQDAKAIFDILVAHFGADAASFDWGTVNFAENAEVSIERAQDIYIGNTTTHIDQAATATDDSEYDVVINAVLSADATDTTMDLTVEGDDNFDISLELDDGERAFTDLSLTLADEHSHYIDTWGDSGNFGGSDFSGSITVSDAEGIDTNGQSITLDYVLASTVTSTSDADLTIDQYVIRAGGMDSFGDTEDYADEIITVTTAGGDDHLTTLAQSALNDGSSINLGAGENRLSLGWGENYADGIDSPELESIGGIDYVGNLSQLDIQHNVQLSEDATTMTMPGGVDNVEVLTFTDLETADGNSVASDLTVEGAANNFSIESDDDFLLGVQDSSVVIGGAPGTSNLTYDITASDDGATTPFTDALTNPSGFESAAYVEIGHRIKGATYVSGFAPGVELPVPDTFSGTGDNAVDNEQMEVYYGTYDAATGIFTVTLTPEDSMPDPFVAPTHTLVLYDNDPVGEVAFAEGLVFPGFFEEDGWVLPDWPAPGQNYVSFDTTLGLYVPFDDGNAGGGDSGSGMDIGVLTVSGADGVEITGDLNVTVDDAVSFNIGNNQLDSLTVDAGGNVDVYAFGNTDAELNIDSISMTTSGHEFLNLNIIENSGTDFAVGSIELLATAGEDSAAPHLIVSNNTDTVLETGNVTLQAGEGHDAQHDFGMDIEDNLRTTVTMAAVALSSDYADGTVSASGNTESTVTFDTLDIDAGCYAEVYFNDNVDSEITVSGNVNVAGENWANLEIDNNTGTNVSLAADGVVSLMSCNSDINVSISGNLNDYDPVVGGPDMSAPTIKTYSVTLGDLVLDSDYSSVIDVSGNDDDTYYGDLTVTIGDVDVVSYDYAAFSIDYNQSATVEVGDVNILSQSNAYIDIYNNDGRLYTSAWGNQVRQDIDYSDITLGDVTVESTDSYAWMWINGNELSAISVDTVSLTASDYADFYVYNNDSTTGEALAEVTVDVDSVTLVADGSSDFWIEYNDASAGYSVDSVDDLATVDITIGDVDMTAGGYAYFGIYDNDVSAGEDGSAEVNINVGDLTVASSSETAFTIEGNDIYSEGYSDNSASLNITLGAIDMTSESGAEWDTAFELEGVDSVAYWGGDASANVTIESITIESENYTYVYIYDSEAVANGDDATSTVTKTIGDVDITSEYGLDFGIDDNDALAGTDSFNDNNVATMDISVGALTVSTGEDNADIDINDNDALIYGYDADWNEATVNITLESVNQSSDWDANLWIENNDAGVEYYDWWGYQDDNSAEVNVTLGTVAIDASIDANFDIDDNDAYIDSYWGEDNSTSVNILVDAVTMTAGGDADFAIDGNDAWVGGEDWYADASVDISVADVSMDASDDVSFLIDNNVATNDGWYSDATVTVSTGDVSIDAGNDVRYVVDGYDSTWTEQGDVTIIAGLDSATAESDEDVYSDVFMNFMDVEGTTSISIEAQSNANGEGNIYGYLENAYDLESLTLTGTNAEVYLVNDMGVHNETGTFTLDLSGMTGSFSEGASVYDPLGENAEYNDGQDNGVYVQTWDADFGDNDVIVKIGASDVIYNAQHSNFSGDSVDFQYDWENTTEDWNGDEGWYSLGNGLDLEPTIAEQSFYIAGFSSDPTGNGDNRYTAASTIFDTGNREFAAVIDYWWDDSDGDRGWYYYNGDESISWYELVGPSWVGVSVGEVEDAFGPDVEIIVNSSDFQGYWYIEDTVVTIRGAADGSDFDYIETAVRDWGYDGDAIYEALVDGSYSADVGITYGVEATDGLGNNASETFEFDAGGIGEVVIGGFRPNGFFAQSEVDRLDFSAFADINSAADLIISIDDNDGYFDDVIIDFVNDDYGVVRLVGVGEYFTDFNVNGIANSINFA